MSEDGTRHPADVWADGALALRGVVEYLGVSEFTVRRIALEQGWPRKRIGKERGIVYPRKLVAEFLASCPDA